MKTITFITDLHVGSHVAALEGVYERARAYGWHVVEIEYERTNRPLSDYIRTWNPAGCILSCSSLTEPFAPEVFRKLPTVYLDPDEKTLSRKCNCVVCDPEPLAKLAVRELENLGCASYGYVGWNEPTAWSEGRRLAFEKLVSGAGGKARSFTQKWTAKDRIGFHRRLVKWLRALPSPCGIFAANDDTACQVAEACSFAGLKSPEDIAIVGVDNFDIICENAATSLTSIEIDFRPQTGNEDVRPQSNRPATVDAVAEDVRLPDRAGAGTDPPRGVPRTQGRRHRRGHRRRAADGGDALPRRDGEVDPRGDQRHAARARVRAPEEAELSDLARRRRMRMADRRLPEAPLQAHDRTHHARMAQTMHVQDVTA